MILTIDGPSGSGKTTIARKVAEKLGVSYFDTGAMYRAVTWALLEEMIPLSEREKVEAFLTNLALDIRLQNNEKRYFVNDIDVTQEIRTQRVNDKVSEVAALQCVRTFLTRMQRSYAQRQSAVFEGRDIGSVVFPEAEVKIFLDAKKEVRAQRRLQEMRSKLPSDAKKFDKKSMLKELGRRDTYDRTRKISPLICPKDAFQIDTSDLGIDEVVDRIIQYHCKKAKKLLPTWFRSKQMHFFYRFIVFLSWCVFKIFYRHKVYGLEHFVRRPGILAPNHTSYWDPPVVAISWPEEIHFLAKESLFRPFLFGPFIRALNSHPVHGDVADVSIFKTILQLLKENKYVVVFPEGKRTNGELQGIKPGIGMLLMRSQTSIIPTYIHGTHEVWGRHQKFPKPFGKTACVFGTPILYESFAHLEKKEAQNAVAETLSESILALKNWYITGAKGIPP